MRKLPVVRASPHLEIDVAIDAIGYSPSDQDLNDGDHLLDVLSGSGLVGRCSKAERPHILAICLDLLFGQGIPPPPQLLGPVDDLVVHVGIIPDVDHLVTPILEVAPHHVKGEGGTRVADVGTVIDGRPARVHPDLAGHEWIEGLFPPAHRVVDLQRHRQAL
ncbi:MAG: hypothetical protein HW395_637 [candidate division NC10 bacterium]|nr:hypothetical protein [candidate division NC10 bacterium]